MAISNDKLTGRGHSNFTIFNHFRGQQHTGLTPGQQLLLKNRKVIRQPAAADQML